MLKRVGAVVLTVVMLLSMVCTFAVASAEGEVAALQVTADKAIVNRGQDVTFTVKLVNQTADLSGIIVKVEADTADLEFVSQEAKMAADFVEEEDAKIAWANTEDALVVPADGICTVTYKAKATAAVGKVTITAIASQATNNKPGEDVGDEIVAPGSVQVSLGCLHDYTGVTPARPTTPVTEANAANAQHSYKCKYGCGETKYEKCSFKLTNTVNHASDKPGEKVYTCEKCGVSYKTVIPAGHETTLTYVAATATKDGKWIERCSICQDEKVTPITAGHPAKDVTNPKKYFYARVQYCKATNLMVGDNYGYFTPNSYITRGAFASILARIYYNGNVPKAEGTLTFSDTKGKWYRHAVQAMYDKGIISGSKVNGKLVYKGDDPLNRQQAVVLLHGLYEKMYNDAAISFGAPGTIVDMKTVANWAKKDVEWAVNTGLIVGNNQKMFNPKNNIKRQDMAIILSKYDMAVRNVLSNEF